MPLICVHSLDTIPKTGGFFCILFGTISPSEMVIIDMDNEGTGSKILELHKSQ
jgi:hypothetical protein